MDMPRLIEIKNGDKLQAALPAASLVDISPATMRWMLPTTFENLLNSLQNDFEWWSENQARMDQRFREWLTGS